MIHHGEHRIHPAVCIVKTQIPDAFVTSLRGLPKIESDVKTMIISHLIIIWAGKMHLSSDNLGRYGHPVARMVVPAGIHLEPVAETARRIDGELVTVVIAGWIPVMPWSFPGIAWIPPWKPNGNAMILL